MTLSQRTILIIISTFIALLFILATTSDVFLHDQGKVTIAYIFTALFLASGVLCCVMLLFVRGTILSRLKSLTAEVRQIAEMHNISARLPLSEHQDELKTLAVSINSMLESLENERKITEESDHMYLERIRQLNDELSRRAIDLAAANNELETFNYSVSHDMRGPLTRISGYCQLLLDDGSGLDHGTREYVARIYESESWLNEMIDALLHLAQVTRVEILSGNINLSKIAEAALKELSLECPDRSVRTCIEPDIVVAGDSRLLKMVIINLLGNAWKYSSFKDDALIEFGALQAESGPVY